MDIHLEEDDSSDEEYQPDDEEEDETAEEVSAPLWVVVANVETVGLSKASWILLPVL